MLIDSAWRLVHEQGSMVAKLIKAKYFPYVSLYIVPSYGPKSTFWSSIRSIRHHLEKHVTIRFIKDDTSVWNQPLVSNLERDARSSKP